MSSSILFQFSGNGDNDVIYTRAINFQYKKILLKRSILFFVTSANIMNFTFHNLELTDTSKLFS